MKYAVSMYGTDECFEVEADSVSLGERWVSLWIGDKLVEAVSRDLIRRISKVDQ